MDGIILIDKPAGISSFGVVARVRRILSERAGTHIKVGHTGTLDPFATGLLILVVGTYCRRAGEFSKLDKTYEATLRLGQTSATGDSEGELTTISQRIPTEDEVEKVLSRFTGTISQRPPIYSAIKINGQRAYTLARKGVVVNMPNRQVMVARLELEHYEYPEVHIVCDVSSGTYVRSLAEDIGQELGTGAYTSQLRRTRIGNYQVREAQPVNESIKLIQM